jgi:nucleoside-diphosphate-sugar epimerase
MRDAARDAASNTKLNMYAITGVTGNVGGAAARALLARGQSVRAVVRNPEKGQFWKDQGCEIALATIEDEASLTVAFQGAEAVFVLALRTSIPLRNFLRPEKLERRSNPRSQQRVRSALFISLLSEHKPAK